MTLAVIDTGVLVSGVFWRHEPHRCVKAWLESALILVVSDASFSEYERVLREVKAEQGFTTGLTPWLDLVRASALWVTPQLLSARACRDPNDDKFIEAALTAKCRLIIARDPDLTDLKKPFGIDILTPRQYLASLPRSVRHRLRT